MATKSATKLAKNFVALAQFRGETWAFGGSFLGKIKAVSVQLWPWPATPSTAGSRPQAWASSHCPWAGGAPLPVALATRPPLPHWHGACPCPSLALAQAPLQLVGPARPPCAGPPGHPGQPPPFLAQPQMQPGPGAGGGGGAWACGCWWQLWGGCMHVCGLWGRTSIGVCS